MDFKLFQLHLCHFMLYYNVTFLLFSWFFRHILATLHFNENVKRSTRVKANGEKYYWVTYPKFKLGEEAVKEVPVTPTYGKPQLNYNTPNKERCVC